MKKSDPFKSINSMSSSDKNEVISGEIDSNNINPHITNLKFSFSRETIHLSQVMNERGSLPRDWVYHFFHGILPKRKRFTKWIKSESDSNDELIESMMEISHLTRVQCKDSIKLLSFSDKREILNRTKRGGFSKQK